MTPPASTPACCSTSSSRSVATTRRPLEYLTVNPNFNPEVGFLRRTDFRRNFAQVRFSPTAGTNSCRPISGSRRAHGSHWRLFNAGCVHVVHPRTAAPHIRQRLAVVDVMMIAVFDTNVSIPAIVFDLAEKFSIYHHTRATWLVMIERDESAITILPLQVGKVFRDDVCMNINF